MRRIFWCVLSALQIIVFSTLDQLHVSLHWLQVLSFYNEYILWKYIFQMYFFIFMCYWIYCQACLVEKSLRASKRTKKEDFYEIYLHSVHKYWIYKLIKLKKKTLLKNCVLAGIQVFGCLWGHLVAGGYN